MKDLSELLNEQFKNIRDFNELLKAQRQFVIDLNYEGLAENLKKEEQIIVAIKKLQEIIDRFSLDDLQANPLYDVLKNELKVTINVNNQNGRLVDNSRNFIKTLLSNLVINSHTLLDRKI